MTDSCQGDSHYTSSAIDPGVVIASVFFPFHCSHHYSHLSTFGLEAGQPPSHKKQMLPPPLPLPVLTHVSTVHFHPSHASCVISLWLQSPAITQLGLISNLE